MDQITLGDYLLLPFYLLAIYSIAFKLRDRLYPKNHPLRTYFIPGLTVKLFGAIFIGLIYQYYYHGGDTFAFFAHCQIINSSFFDSPSTWLRLITHTADFTNLKDQYYISQMYWYDDTSSYTVSCLAAFIGIFCFTKYLVIASLFGVFAFSGSWVFYLCFLKQYPALKKQLFIAILCVPSLVIWGSGLFKDTVCMIGLGWLTFTIYNLFELLKFKWRYLLIMMICMILIFLIKSYILVSFLPFIILKTFLYHRKRVKNNPSNRFAFNASIFMIVLISILSLNMLRTLLLAFSVENVVKTVVVQKDYLLRISLEEGGSAYNLGDFEPTPSGLLKKVGPAINVALFRPYFWESGSILILFNAIEANLLLIFTLYLPFRKNILKIFKQIYRDPNLIMCLGFSLLFAFFVGISSFNFGSLSRYRIPCILFYAVFLVILYYDKNEKKVEPIVKED
ncbi:MAG: hypothetical protein H7098_12980 [Oligoflexus sp.]|nr:hypothetical protein [Pseudopedobacter sp.]